MIYKRCFSFFHVLTMIFVSVFCKNQKPHPFGCGSFRKITDCQPNTFVMRSIISSIMSQRSGPYSIHHLMALSFFMKKNCIRVVIGYLSIQPVQKPVRGLLPNFYIFDVIYEGCNQLVYHEYILLDS